MDAPALRAAVRQFVSSDSPAWKYVNPASARGLARRVSDGGGTREQNEALFRVFMVDRWLRLYNLA